MLRALVLLLLAANLAFFAWTQGWLDDAVGIRARGDREPERLARQVKPDRIVLLKKPASGVASAPGTAPACLEAGPFAPNEVATVEAALRGIVPVGTWKDLRTEKAGVWLVYLGSYPDRAALARKEEELRRVHVDFDELAVPGEGENGAALGRFDDRAEAERALAQFQQRGVRGARVVQMNAPLVLHTLRIEPADPAITAQIAALKLETPGKGFAPCEAGAPSR